MNEVGGFIFIIAVLFAVTVCYYRKQYIFCKGDEMGTELLGLMGFVVVVLLIWPRL